MEQKILVFAYPASGKTFVADNYAGVSDFEFQHYRYDYGEHKDLPLEKLKGRIDWRVQRKEWPENFFVALEQELEKQDVVLVPFDIDIFPILDYLEKQKNVRIIFAIRCRDSFDFIEECFKKRGNSQQFIDRRREDFLYWHDIIDKSPYEKLYIKRNEYLNDALIKAGVNLKAGKGTKNYY